MLSENENGYFYNCLTREAERKDAFRPPKVEKASIAKALPDDPSPDLPLEGASMYAGGRGDQTKLRASSLASTPPTRATHRG